MQRGEGGAFNGARVLIVDDEFLIALNLEYLFADLGATVCMASTLSTALHLASSVKLSLALLDFRLGRETSEAVANVLSERAVPFLFFSAQALPQAMRDRFPRAPALRKPLDIQLVIDVSETLMQSH